MLCSYLYEIVEVCTIVDFAHLFIVVILLDLKVHIIFTVHCCWVLCWWCCCDRIVPRLTGDWRPGCVLTWSWHRAGDHLSPLSAVTQWAANQPRAWEIMQPLTSDGLVRSVMIITPIKFQPFLLNPTIFVENTFWDKFEILSYIVYVKNCFPDICMYIQGLLEPTGGSPDVVYLFKYAS